MTIINHVRTFGRVVGLSCSIYTRAAGRTFWVIADWFGPASAAVRNHVSVVEWSKIFTKMTVNSGGTLVAINTLVHDPDFWIKIMVPTTVGLVTGTMEYLAARSHGANVSSNVYAGYPYPSLTYTYNYPTPPPPPSAPAPPPPNWS